MLREGATGVGGEKVVGTCVYYYLPGAGHDARSRIWITFVFRLEALFRIWEGQGVVQSWTGRQE